MLIKNLIIFSSIFFCSYLSSQKLNDEIFIYQLKSEKKIKNTKSLRYETIHGRLKSGDLNKDFEKDLIKFGYKKVENKKKHQISEKINSLKQGRNNYETACLKTYRDILIYKNRNGKIFKVIKICTSCYSNQIITSERESELLMNFADYDSLQELLK